MRVAYRYSFIFHPRRFDAPREPWPRSIIDRLGALPGVVAWTLFDPTHSWTKDGPSAIRIESRVTRLDVDVAVTAGAAGAATPLELERSLFAVIAELKAAAGATDVECARWTVDVRRL